MFSLLIIFFTVAIVVSFLCSLWEAVLLSITPSYARIKLEEGSRLGKRLQDFKDNIDRPLAAILTLNTIAHTVGAIGVGEQAARIWSETSPFVTSFVVPLVMTLAILVLSELIPKTLGANYWRELAPFTARSLALVIRILCPFIWFSQFLTRSMKKEEGSVFTRSDFMAMADIGARQGVFEQRESEIIASLLQFKSIRVRDVMTPRTVLKTASVDTSIREFFEHNRNLRFSRIPLHEGGSSDHVTGYFLKSDLLARLVDESGDTALGSLRRDITAVGEDFPITELFNRFVSMREHIALVVDEFGGTSGIVTMEDVIETLLGLEIMDESDSAQDMQALARRKWEQRAKKVGLIEPTEPVESVPEPPKTGDEVT